jgi:hypothetical protein
MGRDVPPKCSKPFFIHTSVKNSKFCFPILSHSDSFLQLITPNPMLAVNCSLFHSTTCFDPVDRQQVLVVKLLSNWTVAACRELTSLLLCCYITFGVCCTQTACHSSAPLGTSRLFLLVSLAFFLKMVLQDRSMLACTKCRLLCEICWLILTLWLSNVDTWPIWKYRLSRLLRHTVCVRDSSYRCRKVQATTQNANSIRVRAFDIIRTIVLKTKIAGFISAPSVRISRGGQCQYCAGTDNRQSAATLTL